MELAVDPARLPPGFPPDLASVEALEAFFGRVEAGGLAALTDDERSVLERFFPTILRHLTVWGGGERAGGDAPPPATGGGDEDAPPDGLERLTLDD